MADDGRDNAQFSLLAYGDSLTWGRNPETGGRHGAKYRWPCVVETELGADVRVQAEGLRGRTTIFDAPGAGFNRNGASHLPTVLATHGPFDFAVLLLGTNDLKPAICGSVTGVVVGLRRLATIIRDFPYDTRSPVPEILIVSPPVLCMTAAGSPPAHGRSIDESRKLAPAIELLCQETGCHFLDAARVAETSPMDGVHLDADNTKAIGVAVAGFLRSWRSARPE